MAELIVVEDEDMGLLTSPGLSAVVARLMPLAGCLLIPHQDLLRHHRAPWYLPPSNGPSHPMSPS